MNRSTKIGVVFLCLFALPFALGGLFAISQAIRMMGSEPPNSSAWPLVFFGVVFSAIGFGLMALAIFGSRRVQRQQRLEVEHPAEPWLWREDWAQGRANSTTRNNTIAGWVFAVFWNIVSMPVGALVVSGAMKQKGPVGPALYIVLLFPVIGVFLIVRAIRQTIALFEFGKTYFEMSTVPGVIGRDLTGQIQARFPHSPDHGVHLRLTCVHRVTNNSGNSSTTMESILHRDEAEVSAGQMCPGPFGTTIPVSFRIPLGAHPTLKVNSRDEFAWVLEALADVPGVNYHDIFEVPVFRTQQTPTQEEVSRFAAPASAPAALRPDVATVEVRQNASGTEFYFPAARNLSFAASTTAFMLMFGTITYFLIHRAPFIFPLVFGFFSLLLFFITARLWLGTTRVLIGGSGLTLQSGLLGIGPTRQIALPDIDSISSRITAQQGGATGTPYYDIELKLRDGKKLTLGRCLSNRREVDWLESEMQRLISTRPRSMSAGMN
jgi:hypothetical protein